MDDSRGPPKAVPKGEDEARAWAGADDSSDERSACFHADVDGSVTDWQPIVIAIGPGSRDKVLARLSEADRAVQ